MRLVVDSVAFACYEASCRPPTSGGTGGSSGKRSGPHPNSIQGATKISYNSLAHQKKYGAVVKALDRIHGVADDDFIMTNVVVGRAKNKGGHFDAANRMVLKRGQQPYRRGHAEIRVNSKGNGEEEFSFAHEYGHRVDCVVDPHAPGGTRQVSGTWKQEAPEVRAAFETLWKEAQTTEYRANSLQARRLGGNKYAQYFNSTVEVWARAYAQWASGKIGGNTRKGLYANKERSPYFQWTPEEFDAKIGPAVEGVLRARGLML